MTRVRATGEIRARRSQGSVADCRARLRSGCSSAGVPSDSRAQHGLLSVDQPLHAMARTLAHYLSFAFVFFVSMDDFLVVDVLGLHLGSVARTCAFLLALAWLGAVIQRSHVRYPDSFHWLAYAFFVWSILTFAWSHSLPWTIARTQTYLQMLLMLFILWDLYCTAADLHAALQAYVFGSYASLACLLIGYVHHVSSSPSASYRFTTGEFNPNGLALLLAIGIPFSWYLTLPQAGTQGYRVFLGIVNLLYTPLSLFAIALTGSRGALAASVPAFLFIIYHAANSRRPRMLVRLVVILISVVTLYGLVPTSVIHRLSSLPGDIIHGDLGGRRLVWRYAFSIFRYHPLVGIGSGAFRVALTAHPAWHSEKVVHNTFLSVLVETGVVGFVFFVASLVRVLVALLRRRPAHFRLWLVTLLVWSLGAFNLTWEHRKATWLVMLLALVGSQTTDE